MFTLPTVGPFTLRVLRLGLIRSRAVDLDHSHTASDRNRCEFATCCLSNGLGEPSILNIVRHSPHHEAAQTLLPGKICLHLERLLIVICNPVVVVKRQDLDSSLLIKLWRGVGSVDDFHNLRVHHDADLVAALLSGCTRLVGAPRLKTIWACGREGTPVKSSAQHDLVRADLVAPEQVHGLLDLGKIGVCIEIWPNPFVRLIPCSVEIIAHATSIELAPYCLVWEIHTC